MIRIVTLSGPSGAGKTKIKELFLSSPRNYRMVESCTTRPKRPDERNSPTSEYLFFSQKDFERFIEEKKFAWSIKYDGHYYGTLKQSLKNAISSEERVSIMILTIDGVVALREKISKFGGAPETHIKSFYIWAPKKDLRTRMLRRRDDEQSIRERLRLVSNQRDLIKKIGLIKIKNSEKENPTIVFKEMVEKHLCQTSRV
jgi:guanylate kinase